MVKLGITGGMGSGKTVVSDIFRVLGIPVFDADVEAKKLNNSSSVVRNQLIATFGKDLYFKNQLNKKKFAEIIFSSDENVRKANSIIHPELAKKYLTWVQSHNHLPFTAIDAAVLLEAGFQSIVDNVITVHAPLQMRVNRAMKRDGASSEQVKARMSKQMPEEEKIRLSDFVIYNDNTRSLLVQVDDVLNALI